MKSWHKLLLLAALATPVINGGCALFEGGSDNDTSDLKKNHNLPRTARKVESGSDVVRYTAERDGMIYLLDSNDNKLLYSAKVSDGDRVRCDPEKDRVYINDREERVDQKKDHEHVLFFDARSSGGSRDVPAGAKEVESGDGDLQFRPRSGGTVYITDEDGRLVTSFKVSDGDTIRVEPKSGRVTANGSRVSNASVSRGEHKIYFDAKN